MGLRSGWNSNVPPMRSRLLKIQHIVIEPSHAMLPRARNHSATVSALLADVCEWANSYSAMVIKDTNCDSMQNLSRGFMTPQAEDFWSIYQFFSQLRSWRRFIRFSKLSADIVKNMEENFCFVSGGAASTSPFSSSMTFSRFFWNSPVSFSYPSVSLVLLLRIPNVFERNFERKAISSILCCPFGV